jgi:hypothetical protein
MAVFLSESDAAQVTLASTDAWERRDLDSDYARNGAIWIATMRFPLVQPE